jgi:hypothetical protein
MAAILDHIHMGCTNVYTTAFDLTKTTRIGHYDGGFAGNITIGQKTVPLGGSTYLEIEGIVDPFATADVARRPWWYKRAVAVKSSIFSGVRLRVNTMDELREMARRHGGRPSEDRHAYTAGGAAGEVLGRASCIVRHG